jgi:hypothetical protein
MKLPTDPLVQALVQLYKEAEATLQAQVTQAIASGQLGSARYRQERLQAVQRLLADLQGEAVPQSKEAVWQGYQVGIQISQRAAAGFFESFGTGIHEQAVGTLTDNLVKSLNEATDQVGRRVDDVFRREGLRHSALALIGGSTRTEASKKLEQTLLNQGKTSFVDKLGRNWGLAAYSSMVIRTTTREAASYGTANRLIENGDDLVTVSRHKDTDGPDILTGKTKGYPVMTPDTYPPFHPNCRHVIAPATASFAALEASLGLSPSTAVALAS